MGGAGMGSGAASACGRTPLNHPLARVAFLLYRPYLAAVIIVTSSTYVEAVPEVGLRHLVNSLYRGLETSCRDRYRGWLSYGAPSIYHVFCFLPFSFVFSLFAV